MVWAETSKRLARSSTITRPKARAIFRISFWRWVSRVTGSTSGKGALMVRLFRRAVNAADRSRRGKIDSDYQTRFIKSGSSVPSPPPCPVSLLKVAIGLSIRANAEFARDALAAGWTRRKRELRAMQPTSDRRRRGGQRHARPPEHCEIADLRAA